MKQHRDTTAAFEAPERCHTRVGLRAFVALAAIAAAGCAPWQQGQATDPGGAMITGKRVENRQPDANPPGLLVPDERAVLRLPVFDGALRIGRSGVFVDAADARPPRGGFPPSLAEVSLAATLREAIRSGFGEFTTASSAVIVDTPEAASMRLLPSATLHLRRDGLATLAVRVALRRMHAAPGLPAERQYWYRLPESRPLTGLGGWSEDDATVLQDACDTALRRIAPIILADLRGEFSPTYLNGATRVVRWQSLSSAAPARSLLLGESDTDLIVMPIVRERPVTGIIAILDRDRIRLEPAEAVGSTRQTSAKPRFGLDRRERSSLPGWSPPN